MAGAAILSDCSICCDDYNNSTRACITCPYSDCNYKACKGCIRQYLLGTAENPHCMNCRKAWAQDFVVMSLNRSFVTSDYKTHRRNLLLEREISKMPETMEAANRYKKTEILREKMKEIDEDVKKMKLKEKELWSQYHTHRHQIYLIENGNSDTQIEKRKFIMPCANTDCRGYLSTQYKCDLCELYTCKNCIEVIGYTKDDPHECNENSVKSAELIKKDTKPCPTCGTRIFKIEGCDQMWCTECHTAFSWKSGRIDIGTVHNPHYYQYQASMNNGQAPRNPQDVLCGGFRGWYDLRTKILRRIPTHNSATEEIKLHQNITKLHRTINHITQECLRKAREKVRSLENTEPLRIDYILKKKSKDDLSLQIYRNDNLRRKYMELLHIYELLSVVGIEMFNEFCSKDAANLDLPDFVTMLKNKIEEYNKLCQYCNKQLETISISYNQTVPQFTANWEVTSKRFSLSKAKAKKMQAAVQGAEVQGAEVQGAVQGAEAPGAAVQEANVIISSNNHI